MALGRRFQPLLVALEALASEQEVVRFTFAELEALLQAPLPPSAMGHSYWHGSSLSHYNWEFIGFRARLDRATPAVVFTRMARRRR